MTYSTEPDWVYFNWTEILSIYGLNQSDIYLAVIKEIIDNFLDAADEQKKRSMLSLVIQNKKDDDQTFFAIACNTLIEEETIQRVFGSPFGTRVSSKTFARLPSRGLFGMASKVIQALPYAIAMMNGKSLNEPPIQIIVLNHDSKYAYLIGANVDLKERKATPVCLRTDGELTPFPSAKIATSYLSLSEKKCTCMGLLLPTMVSVNSDRVRELLEGYLYLNPSLVKIFYNLNGDVDVLRQPARIEEESGPVKIKRPSILAYSVADFRDAFYVQNEVYPKMKVVDFIRGYKGWKGFSGFTSKSLAYDILDKSGLEGNPCIKDVDVEKARKLYDVMFNHASSHPLGQFGLTRSKMPVLGKKNILSLYPSGNLIYKCTPVKGGTPSGHTAIKPWIMESFFLEREEGKPTVVVIGVNRSPLLNNPFRAYVLNCKRRVKGVTTSQLMQELSKPVLCVIHLAGIIQPLSPNKAEIDAKEYLDEYESVICGLHRRFRRKRAGRKGTKMKDWLIQELESRSKSEERRKEIVSQQSLWYKARNWYLQNNPGETTPDISREHFIKSIREICNRLGRSRESLGIFAAERALIYFRGSRVGLSLENISEVFKWGSDILVIEKEGICALLEPFAARYGVALINSRGQLVDYAEKVIEMAKGTGARIYLLTDMDDAGFVIRKNLKGIECVGVDQRMIEGLAEKIGMDPSRFKEQVEEVFHPNFVGKDSPISLEQWRQLGWSGQENPTRADSLKRVEIDALIAIVGAETLWNYLLTRMQEVFKVRDLTRSLKNDSELALQSLPAEVQQTVQQLQDIFVSRTTESVRKELDMYKNWDKGFVEIDELEGKIVSGIRNALAEKIDKPSLDELKKNIESLKTKAFRE